MSEVEKYVKEWIKKGKPFRIPGFLCKRIIEKENCSYEEAKAILDRIVAEDRSLRYIYVATEWPFGLITPEGRPPRKLSIAYHQYLEPNGVYRGRSRGRPRNR